MKRHKPAFTLIELLIAVLIFSIITSIIYSTFSTGTSVWKRTKTATQVSMNMNSVLEDLARDLRGALNYKGLEFIGAKDSIYFCYLSDTISEDSQYTELYRACYYLRLSGKEAGKFDLLKRSASLARGGFAIDEVPERELITAIDNFKIEYAYRGSEGEVLWEEMWENPDDLPRCIKVGVYKGDIKLTKYISVPTGKLGSLEAE